MKKIVLLLTMVLIVHNISAQFVVTPNGLMTENNETANVITIEYAGVLKEKLYKTYKEYAKTYSEKRRELSFFDNESNGFMIKFINVGRFGTTAVKTGSTSFVLLFMFKDELVEIQARDFSLRRISLFQGEAKQYVYTKKGKLSRSGKILKPMIEREVNIHFNDIVNTVSSLIAIKEY
jgi:hypothetical protein